MQTSCNIPRKPHASAARIKAEKSPFTWSRCQTSLKPHFSQVGIEISSLILIIFLCEVFVWKRIEVSLHFSRSCAKDVSKIILKFHCIFSLSCAKHVSKIGLKLHGQSLSFCCPVQGICLKMIWTFIVNMFPFLCKRFVIKRVLMVHWTLSFFSFFCVKEPRICLKNLSLNSLKFHCQSVSFFCAKDLP